MAAGDGVVVLGACLLPGLAAALLPAGTEGDRGVLAAGALGSAVLLGSLWSWRRRGAPPLRHLIAAAALLRLLVWIGPQRFDDDLWRYLWDGIVTLEGTSPYRFAPRQVAKYDPAYDPLILGEEAAAQLGRLAARATDPGVAGVLERINFPHLPTIYPPASQLAFAAAAALAPGNERLWRAVTAAADLLVVLVLARVLAALGRPRWWVAAYALHPLPALEFAAGGHQDSLGVLLLALAVLALAGRKRRTAGAALAAAGGVKVFPLVLLLPWARRLGAGGSLALLAAGAVLAAPFFVLGSPDLRGLSTYARHWEYFSGPYALFGAAAESLGDWGGRFLLLAVLAVLAGASRFWRHDAAALDHGGRWLEVLLVLSPVVNPWYVPWGLAVGVLRGSLAWPVFAALVPAAYFGYTPAGHPWSLRLLVWTPFLVLWLWETCRPSATLRARPGIGGGIA